MTRIAIYARYSSDLQKQSSIEDQVRLCEEKARRETWQVVNCYTDPAISGSTMMMRPGIRMLMQDALAGQFDIVLTEALDRLSRDQADMAMMYKRLSFNSVRIVTLSEGDVGVLAVGFKGIMNQLYITEMAEKVKRGQRGRVECGKVTAGLAYGYDVVKRFDARGELVRGERVINEEQAAIVQRIFAEYVGGRSPKAIAARLNREGIRSPSGRGWNQSTINGRREAGYGILNNHIYVGEMIWNRVSERRCPDTGRVLRRLNPKEEWITKSVPELRILPQDLWEQAKTKQDGLLKGSKQFWQAQRPKYLLSGLMRCGTCGGAIVKQDRSRYGCATHKNKGTCDNHLMIRQADVEGYVLGALQGHFMNEEALRLFCEEYTKHVNSLRMERNARAAGMRRELEKLADAKQRVIEAIKEGIPAREVKDELAEITRRRDEIESTLAGIDESPTLLHPSMAKHYMKSVTRLISSLERDDQPEEAREVLRSLIDKIVLTPDTRKKSLNIDLHGDLAGILCAADESANRNSQPSKAVQMKLVGPAGLEPAT